MKHFDILIRNGMVVDPLNAVFEIRDIGLRNGCVEESAPGIGIEEAALVLDARGKLVLPGIVDSHAHLVRPNAEGAAFAMLLKSGVTTAAGFAGPVATVKKEIREKGCGMNALVLEALRPGKNLSGPDPSPSEVAEAVAKALSEGAFGVKILGGHYPVSPDAISRIVRECARQKCYVAIHAGSTTRGSNIEGFEQAVELSEGLPLHVAHINSYCRGTVQPPLAEVKRALEKLEQSPNILSESYLSVDNGTDAALDENDLPASHVTRTCLEKNKYSPDKKGLEKAIQDGYAKIYALIGGELQYLTPEDGLVYWRNHLRDSKCSFPVNSPVSLSACAVAKNEAGRFVIPAISSDGGGIPRNVILSNGIRFVHMGYLTLPEFVRKTSLNPAAMFGLSGKGHLSPGADGDVIIADPANGHVETAIVGGTIRMSGGVVHRGSGMLITSERGVQTLRKEHVPHSVADLGESAFLKGRW